VQPVALRHRIRDHVDPAHYPPDAVSYIRFFSSFVIEETQAATAVTRSDGAEDAGTGFVAHRAHLNPSSLGQRVENAAAFHFGQYAGKR
jgi:hypothetical protein